MAERETKVEAAKKEAEERVRSGFEEWDAAQKLGEVEPTSEEKLKGLRIVEGKRKSIDSTDTNSTNDSATKANDGKSIEDGTLTSPTTVDLSQPAAGPFPKPAAPADEKTKPKPRNRKPRYNAKKSKNAGATANDAISKSLANLKASYTPENPLPPSDSKPKKPRARRSKKPKSVPDNKQPIVVGDVALEPKLGTDRGNIPNGVNEGSSKQGADCLHWRDALQDVDANLSKPEPTEWLNVSPKINMAPKDTFANLDRHVREPQFNSAQHGKSRCRKPLNATSGNVGGVATDLKPNGHEGGPLNPQHKFSRSRYRPKRPPRQIGGITREEYQFPPEIMRLPKHLRPMPPPGWRLPPLILSEPVIVPQQFAKRGVKDEDDDDAAYGIVNFEELAGKKGKETEKKGWINDRPASWWKEKARREREEDGIVDSESGTDPDVPTEYDWWLPEEGGVKEMEGEGENWDYIKDGPFVGDW